MSDLETMIILPLGYVSLWNEFTILHGRGEVSRLINSVVDQVVEN